MKQSVFAASPYLYRLAWFFASLDEVYPVALYICLLFSLLTDFSNGCFLTLTHLNSHIVRVHYKRWYSDAPLVFLSHAVSLTHRFLLSAVCLLIADPGRSVMSARFRLPAGRSYNVRATELERDRQHTQVVCNVLLLDNTVQAFKVSVSTALSHLTSLMLWMWKRRHRRRDMRCYGSYKSVKPEHTDMMCIFLDSV